MKKIGWLEETKTVWLEPMGKGDLRDVLREDGQELKKN